jgi:hypothetical protein
MSEAHSDGGSVPSPEAGFAGREARMTLERVAAVKEGALDV